MTLKTELIALAFGAMLILVTFGDDYYGKIIRVPIGNLDTIFGLKFWPFLDIFYFLGTIVLLVLYGWVKAGGLTVNRLTIITAVTFIAVLVLMNIDDFAQVLNLPLNLPQAYWLAITFVYPVYGVFAFFIYGKANERN